MSSHQGSQWLRAGVMACAVGLSSLPGVARAQTNETTAATVTNQPPTDPASVGTNLTAQSVQQLTDQQQALMRAIEQTRAETEAANQKTTEALNARLKLLEASLANQREQALAAMQSSHQLTLLVVGVVASIGIGGMALFAVLFVRTLNRRVDLTGASTLPVPYGHGFGVPVGPAGQAAARFHGEIDRVEQRMSQLEAIADAPAAPGAPVPVAGEAATVAVPDPAGRIALLIGKGQALLNLEKPAEALVCFDEILAVDPHHANALVKKGSALERLGRLDEAIEHYDRAIALNDGFTMAYLCKGAVFNRQERYGEALECYEQALRTHEKSRAP